jgi:hypothetical protein
MKRQFLILTLYSIIAFCVISYFSVMLSLLNSIGEVSQKPVTNIGFPFKYYYQFWTSGSDSPNCGWNINNFIIDFILIYILTFATYLVIKKLTKKNN